MLSLLCHVGAWIEMLMYLCTAKNGSLMAAVFCIYMSILRAVTSR